MIRATGHINGQSYSLILIDEAEMDDLQGAWRSQPIIGVPIAFTTSKRVWPSPMDGASVSFQEMCSSVTL